MQPKKIDVISHLFPIFFSFALIRLLPPHSAIVAAVVVVSATGSRYNYLYVFLFANRCVTFSTQIPLENNAQRSLYGILYVHTLFTPWSHVGARARSRPLQEIRMRMDTFIDSSTSTACTLGASTQRTQTPLVDRRWYPGDMHTAWKHLSVFTSILRTINTQNNK